MAMANFFSSETVRPAFETKPTPVLSYGMRFPEACARHIHNTFQSSRVYVIVSKSLSENTDVLQSLKHALKDAIVGIRIGISPHTPIPEIVAIIEDVRKIGGVDCIVTVGAGSITDGAKLLRFALANAASTEADIDTLWGKGSENPSRRDAMSIRRPTIPLICVPTSLSGGEYQAIAGATDTASHAKRRFEPLEDPDLVIQDPELCQTTPEWVWLSTGIRSVDHCVETLCSLQSNDQGDSSARKGLTKLIPGLLRSKAGPEDDDLQARHLCQLGVVEAMCAVSSGTPLGASHAIGHQLGPLGVGHGETSCILLPAVCKFNAKRGANNERQAELVKLLESLDAVQRLIKASGLNNPDLGDILDLVIRELGMPRTLKDVKVGKEKLHILARNSLEDMWIKTNPVPITEERDVMEILEMVVGENT